MYDTDKITLRRAILSDLPLLLDWEKQPHVIAAGVDDDWNWEEAITRRVDWDEQLVAQLNGQPIGFIQIIDPEKEITHYWGNIEPNLRAIDIWIGYADNLNKGYGTTMMQQALNRCFANPVVTAVLIDPLASNTNAIRFYQRMGFNFVERRMFGDDDCAVHQITRANWEKENKI
jgi:aminoglycoside 6'-N-acetyltransferase